MRKAFTLFEVLVSLVILTILLSTISKLLLENNNLEIYKQLQKDENDFVLDKTISDTEYIKFKGTSKN